MEGFYVVLGGTVIIALIAVLLSFREDHRRKLKG